MPDSRMFPALAAATVDGLRGERLRAALDAAVDVAKGSHNPRLQALACEVVRAARARGLVA